MEYFGYRMGSKSVGLEMSLYRKCNMRFNPDKCTFDVQEGKFLGLYLTERGI